MLKNSFFNMLTLTSLLIFFPCDGFTSDINVKLVPEKIFPGDAFLVEIKSVNVPLGKFDDVPLKFYPVSDGLYQAIFSVDVEMKPGNHAIYLVTNERSIKHTFTVHKKKFSVKSLTLRSDKVFLSPENQARVNEENEKLSTLWNRITKPMWEGNFTPPVNNTSISSPFGVMRIINQKENSRHRGVDYRAPKGKPIKAINSGVVVLTEEHFYGGNTVMINHGGGIYSIYLHLSEFKVKEGQRVNKNDVIGLVGATGRATGPHLHLSVKIGGRSVNPESLFVLPLDES
jgi:murein DD-endopeptidase MepM/ murein hydrolase activator NlpD